MSKAELLASANRDHTLLETARHVGDYDAAQQICEHLMVTYRMLELLRLKEAEAKGVDHDSHP
jgi:hypothetical protein